MTKIFISYNTRDEDFARQLSNELKTRGYEIAIDFESVLIGENWRQKLSSSLRGSDVYVVLLSESSLRSQYVQQEIGAARAYASESDRMLIVPVLIDDIKIPGLLSDFQILIQPDRNLTVISDAIERAISAFLGRRAAKEEKAVEVANKIQRNAAEFIGPVVATQKLAERRNQVWGIAWYAGGFVALLVGLALAVLSFLEAQHSSVPPAWQALVESIFRGIVAIGFLAACARYSFALGKSYTSESLKCSDRIHAISFGEFYLQVYGEKATWSELKEVFKDWNIDRTSTFSGLDVSQIDPQILTFLGNLASAALGKKE